MHLRTRSLGLAAVLALAFSALGFSQSKVPDRLTAPIMASQRTVTNLVNPQATRQNDQGRVSGSQVFHRMVLMLQRSPAQETALQQLLAEQQDPTSPLYHQWLTPAQFGQRFGVSDNDLAKITGWLQAQGFTVEKPTNGRQFLFFTGTSAQVETAFQTEMHHYSVGGKTYIANAKPASIPTALAPDVKGVASLTSMGTTRKPQYHMAANPKMQIGSGFLTGPADLAAIYDAAPLQKNQVEGQGQSIALIEESNINPQDVTDFRTITGLPAATLNVIVNGPDPGPLVSDGEETEAIADVEYAGSLAPDAALNVIVSASTGFNQGIDYSTIYAVDYAVSPITSLSYAGCEALDFALGNVNTFFLYGAAYEQGAAEGISHFVSAGDYGGDACGSLGAYGISPGYGVNDIGQSTWNVSVGGTEFIMPDPDTYFPPAKNYLAQGYIPESTWNDYENPYDGRPLAGGGGISVFYSKPDWQAGPGVPADGERDVPDVSLLAGDNLAYMVCQKDVGGDCSQGYAIGLIGTSLASPSWASIQALVNQKNNLMDGAGNPNPTYYKLAAGQNSPFHDITVGDTKVPDANGSLIGYQATAGYDLATGLGSVDVNALATSWTPPTGSGQTTVTLDTGGVTTITHGDALTTNVTVAATSGSTIPSGDLVYMAGTQGVYRATLDSTGKNAENFGGSGNGVVLPGGSYDLVAHYAGDNNFAPADSNHIALTVNPEPTATLVASNVFVAAFGTPITLFAASSGVNSGTGYAMPGTYTFTENDTTLGTALLLKTGESFADLSNPLTANLTLAGAQSLPAGTHSINASSPPADASFLASTSTTPAAILVVKGSVLVSLSPDHTNPAVNSTVNLLATALNVNGFGAPVTGTVEIRDYSTKPFTVLAKGTLGGKADNAGGFDVSLPVTFATAGLHPLVAVYDGDANNNGGPSGAVDITVGAAEGTKMSTSTTIAPGAGLVVGEFAMANTNVTISASVSGDTGGTAPTGTITFVDAANNNAAVGTANVGANGTASLTTKTLTGGKHFIVANYSGDTNFAASSSQSIEVVIGDFTVSVNPASASVAAGQSSSITITYTGSADFTQMPDGSGMGSIGLSCSGLPQGGQCGFSTAVIAPTVGANGTTTGTATVTITTAGPTLQKADNQLPRKPFGGAAPLAFAGLFLLGIPLAFRKRRTFTALLGLVLLGVVATLNGCSSSGTPVYKVTNPGTPAGSSTVTITATVNGGSNYGTLTHTATVALTVTAQGSTM
jgi:hypothetical protein